MKLRQKIFVFLAQITLNFIIQIYQITPSIHFPLKCRQYGYNEIIIGAIISLSAIGGILMSFLYYSLVKYIDKFNLQIIFQLLQLLSCIGFGIAGSFSIDQRNYFLIFSIISRFVQGLSYGGQIIIIFIYTIELFQDDLQKYISIIELVITTAIGFGSICSTFFYEQFGGYSNMFYILSILMVIQFVFSYSILFNYKNQLDQISQLSQNSSYNSYYDQISMQENRSKMNYKLFLTLLMAFQSFALIFFPTSQITIYWKDQLNLSKYEISYMFLFESIGYIICNLFIIFNVLNFDEKLKIFFGMFFQLFANFFFFQQKSLGLGKSVIQIQISTFFSGIMSCIIVTAIIPEILHLLKQQNDYYNNQDEINQQASIYFNFAENLGMLFGPLAGGLLFRFFEFQTAYNIYLLFGYFLTFFYLISFFDNNTKTESEYSYNYEYKEGQFRYNNFKDQKL